MKAAEACIYTKQFSAKFRGCPFFYPTSFTPTTWTGEPLQSRVVCRHLEVAGPEHRGPFFPRCGLGGPDAVGLLMDELNGVSQSTG